MDYTQDRLRKSIDTACKLGHRGLSMRASGDEHVDSAVMHVLRSWGCQASRPDEFTIFVSW